MVPPGAVVVPITVERMTGRVEVKAGSLTGSGLSEGARQAMKNIDGFIGTMGSAAMPALMDYVDKKGRMGGPKAAPAPVEVLGKSPGLVQTQGQWSFQLPEGQNEVFLGRNSFADPNQHHRMSAQHVRIFRSSGGVFIRDMGSLNGTRVIRGGREVYRWHDARRQPGPTMALHPGDQVVLGDTTMVIR
jgi:hypothetical protein